MAERLEGKKLRHRSLECGRLGEIIYRVDRFRRFLPKRGLNGLGLIQFWGIRASRSYLPGAEPPAWDAQDDIALHTVGVGRDLYVETKRGARA